ncbi:hypothetical protein I5907_16125 [Panacibacter sp. DH6]|uniref:Coproporphyrinogen III oxidase n=1 Tax=Panacibacter microcysteis TaxID=2793269 RepID=A0A931GWK4_9BACT|nr:hypothetical protein [Panacibacter microcysteis]MBG9377770.1 hypothetical protein [Panacibacter microcysteis]
MKKTTLFLMALCVSASCLLTACGTGDNTNETNSDTATTESLSPAPMDTTSTMPADTSMMTDSTAKP